MRRLLLTLAAIMLFTTGLAAPALASEAPGLFIEWGVTSYQYDIDGNSVGALVRLADTGVGTLYYDLGMDYTTNTTTLDFGLTLRSGHPALLFFHPYVGFGLAYQFDNYYELGWNANPYFLYGTDFLCFFYEEQLQFSQTGADLLVRTGFRLRF